MLRFFDFAFSLVGIVCISPLLFVIFVLLLFDTGSPIFVQERVGRYKKPFKLIKFRTMRKSTTSVASHLVDRNSITKIGIVLRKTKFDELPQLINVLKGDMSLVGPRPNLFNQETLIEERERFNIYIVRPGITGLAQIKNIDMSTPTEIAMLDYTMISELTVRKYFFYLIATVLGKGFGDAVK
ncbi:sugar transferase [Vibrio vulnificus]|nr:sugar transferase [Vibrio vulnificus]